jgi:hypothetical protein
MYPQADAGRPVLVTALTRLSAIASDARNRRFAEVELEARLAEVEIEMKSGAGNAASHRAVIEKVARAEGMTLLAQRAAPPSNH